MFWARLSAHPAVSISPVSILTTERQPKRGRNRQRRGLSPVILVTSPGTVATRPHHLQFDRVDIQSSRYTSLSRNGCLNAKWPQRSVQCPSACALGFREEDGAQWSTLHSCALFIPPSQHLLLHSVCECVIICVFSPWKQMRTVIFPMHRASESSGLSPQPTHTK